MVFFMSSSLSICENINSMQYGSINAKLYNTVISYGILTILPCVFRNVMILPSLMAKWDATIFTLSARACETLRFDQFSSGMSHLFSRASYFYRLLCIPCTPQALASNLRMI